MRVTVDTSDLDRIKTSASAIRNRTPIMGKQMMDVLLDQMRGETPVDTPGEGEPTKKYAGWPGRAKGSLAVLYGGEGFAFEDEFFDDIVTEGEGRKGLKRQGSAGLTYGGSLIGADYIATDDARQYVDDDENVNAFINLNISGTRHADPMQEPGWVDDNAAEWGTEILRHLGTMIQQALR